MKKNKLKNIIKIIAVNLLVFYILLSIFNYLIYYNKHFIGSFILEHDISRKIVIKNLKINNFDINKYEIEKTTVKVPKVNNPDIEKLCGEERIEFGTNYTKKPVMILGCSYAYGYGLPREQTFPYLLSELTKRPVYNFAGCGGNILFSYNILINNNIPNISDTEYIIYIYMHDHINRYLQIDNLYYNYQLVFPQSNKIHNKLLEIPFYKLICVIWQINKIVMGGGSFKLYIENSKDLMKNIIIKTYNELKKEAPNAKMIIILYDEKMADMYDNVRIIFDSEIQNSDVWDEIEKETDIKVVRTKDLTGFLFDKNYKLKEDIADWHPNEKAWKVFTPLFVKKYMI